MELNYFGEYILSVDIDSFEILNLKNAPKEDILNLAEMYCTLFNSDNKKFLKLNKKKGRTLDEGIWYEKPFDYKKCINIINNYVEKNYIGVYAAGFKGNEKFVLGAVVMKKTSLVEMKKEGFDSPFDLTKISEFWKGVDTFKREFTVKGRRATNFSSILRHKLVEMNKTKHHTLIYSSTNNPVMVKVWKKEHIYVIEKTTKDGNKFQGFKVI
jgi:hypothetical protein